MKYSVNAPQVPDADGPYAQGTTAGRLVFVAGQIGSDPDDPCRLVEGGVREQAERIIEIMSRVLAEAGCTLEDVAQTTVYLANLDDLPCLDAVYESRFKAPAPARTVVEVSRLPHGALVEMDCVACR